MFEILSAASGDGSLEEYSMVKEPLIEVEDL